MLLNADGANAYHVHSVRAFIAQGVKYDAFIHFLDCHDEAGGILTFVMNHDWEKHGRDKNPPSQ